MKQLLPMILLCLSAGPALAHQAVGPELLAPTPLPIPEPSPEPSAYPENEPDTEPDTEPVAIPPAHSDEDAWLDELLHSELPIEFHVLFSSGYLRVPLGTLATRLEAQGYGAVPQDFLSFGASVQMLAWDVLTEFEGQAGIGWPLAQQDYWLNMTANQTFFNLGYRFHPLEQLSIYPIAGIGISVLELNFSRSAVPPTFDGALAAPAQQGQLAHRAFALNLGLGLDWRWGNWGQLGLRGGIIWLPVAGAWTTSASPNDRINRRAAIADGPELGNIAPYLRLNIGF